MLFLLSCQCFTGAPVPLTMWKVIKTYGYVKMIVFCSCCCFFFEILLDLPYSRKLEEADEVGMNMAAKVQKLTSFLFFNLF